MRQLKEGKYLGTNRKSLDADGVIISETEYREKVYDGAGTSTKTAILCLAV